jgi:hypothetical protein
MEKATAKYYIKGLIVERNYSLLARQLLYGAMDAWVFGGMGSMWTG